MPDCYATSVWPMLRSEGVWTLNLRLDSSVERIAYKSRHPGLCRMPDCYATSAWPMLRSEGVWTLSQRLDSPGRKGLDNGPTIRLLGRKDQNTKMGTLTLQDTRLPCGKRMVYATVRGSLNAGSAIRFLGQKRSEHKIGHSGFAGCPIAMRQAQGLCCGRRGSGR